MIGAAPGKMYRIRRSGSQEARPAALAEQGVTLVELLAAIVLSALVVALASRLFLGGQREFLARVFETDRLSDMIRLKGTLRQALRADISRCEGGGLHLASDTGAVDLAAHVKARFPGADTLAFRCFEIDAAGDGLTDWKERMQPRLVEYRIVLRTRGKPDRLEGSFLR